MNLFFPSDENDERIKMYLLKRYLTEKISRFRDILDYLAGIIWKTFTDEEEKELGIWSDDRCWDYILIL